MSTANVIETYPDVFTKKHYRKNDIIKLLFDNFCLTENKVDALTKIINLMPNASTIKILLNDYQDVMMQIIEKNNLQKGNIAPNSFKSHSYESLVARFFRGKLNICPNDSKYTTHKFCSRQCWAEYNKKLKDEKLKQKRTEILNTPVVDHTKEFDEHAMDHIDDDKFMSAIQSCLKPGEKLFSERRAKIARTKYMNSLKNKKNNSVIPDTQNTQNTQNNQNNQNTQNTQNNPKRPGIFNINELFKPNLNLNLNNLKLLTKQEEERASKYLSDKDLDNLVDIFTKSNGNMNDVASYLNKIINV